MMRIAILAWGSLVWDQRDLLLQGGWHSDGPALSVEFARISEDGRLTLVLYPGPTAVSTFWALSRFNQVEPAAENLRERERTSLHRVGRLAGSAFKSQFREIENTLRLWLDEKSLDACIWTDLPSNFREKRSQRPTAANAINYLAGLEGEKAKVAENYVRKTPRQIRTPFRSAIEAKLGWRPASDFAD